MEVYFMLLYNTTETPCLEHIRSMARTLSSAEDRVAFYLRFASNLLLWRNDDKSSPELVAESIADELGDTESYKLLGGLFA